MIKVKDKLVTINGDPDDLMTEYAILTAGMTAAIGITGALAAFVKGLDEGTKLKDDDGEEETE